MTKNNTLQKYYTWDEIEAKLNLPLHYFDSTVHFIAATGADKCCEVVIQCGGEFYACTVNQFFNIYDYIDELFDFYNETAPSQEEWKKIRRLSKKGIERWLKKQERRSIYAN